MSGKQLDGFEYLYMEVSSFSKTFLITHANQLSQACEDEILDRIWEFLNFFTKLLQIKHLTSIYGHIDNWLEHRMFIGATILVSGRGGLQRLGRSSGFHSQYED